MDEKQLKNDAKSSQTQVEWPKEPEAQLIYSEIINLLWQALHAEDILKAIDYFMAARGLFFVAEKLRKRKEG